MENQKITKGASVYFDIGRGTQSGTVIDLLPCITNGRQHAIVELDHQLPGILQTVPVDQLNINRGLTTNNKSEYVRSELK
jgi:hypothetical protein